MRTEWKACVIVATLTVTSAYAEKPKFVVGEGGAMCHDIARFLRDMDYTPDSSCQWIFRPNGPNAQSPKWRTIDIRQHMAWYRDFKVGASNNLTPDQIDALWDKEFTRAEIEELERMKQDKSGGYWLRWSPERKRRAVSSLEQGHHRFEYAEFDMNHDGKPERVLAVLSTKCTQDNGIEDPRGIALLVIGANGRVDGRYRRDNFGLNPFFYQGETYFARRRGSRYVSDGSAASVRLMQQRAKRVNFYGSIEIVSGGLRPRGGRGEISFGTTLPLCRIDVK